MSRYIDADKAIELIKNGSLGVPCYNEKYAIDCIEAIPTADVVPKARFDEAMELIEILKSEIPTTGLEQCSNCINEKSDKLHNCVFIKNDTCVNFKWQHQDRYEKLKSEVGQNG